MNTLWAYFWPIVSLGLVVGALAGWFAFRAPASRPNVRLAGRDESRRQRRRKSSLIIAAGGAAVLAAAALWHGPLGAADRFKAGVGQYASATLTAYEMTHVQARLQSAPLTRRMVLAGRADNFQRSELKRMLSDIPGVSRAQWSNARGAPLIVELFAAAMAAFALGLVLAYIIELRRRAVREWRW